MLTPQFCFGQILAWQFGSATGSENTYNATTNNTNLTTSYLQRVGTTVYTSISRAFVSDSWPTTSISSDKYIQFVVQARPGYRVSLSTLDIKLIKSTFGPSSSFLFYSLNGGTSFNQMSGEMTATTAGAQQPTITLSSYVQFQKIPSTISVIFRLFAYGGFYGGFGIGATASGTTNNCLAINGLVEQIVLIPSSTSLNVAKTSSSSVFTNITSNATWSAISDQSWLTVTSGGMGNGKLTCTANANATVNSRKANVTLKTPGLADQIISVIQEAGDAILTLSATTAAVAKTINSTATVDVISNIEWTATSDQNWLTVTAGAAGNATLTCKAVAPNLTITTRTAAVTVKGIGIVDKLITVTQDAGDATLLVSATTANISKTENSTANVDVTSNTTWTAISDQNWLTVTAGATGNATLTCTVIETNPTITTRTANVTLKASGVADKTIIVTQAKGDVMFSVSALTLNIAAATNSNASINVISNTTWKATSNQSWLTVSNGGTGNALLLFTATTNSTSASREALVTLSATGAADIYITINQLWGANDLNKYQLSMTVTSVLAIDDKEVANTDTKLAVFIGEECRGAATLKYIADSKRYMAFMMVWGDVKDVNEIIYFKCIERIDNVSFNSTNSTVKFIPDKIVGSATSPLKIDFAKKITNIDSVNEHVVQVYPNPVTDAFHINGLNGISTLSLTDLSGRLMLQKQVSDNESVSINTFPQGIYVLKISNKDSVCERKIVKQ